MRSGPGLLHASSDDGSNGIGISPACAGNEKGPREGALERLKLFGLRPVQAGRAFRPRLWSGRVEGAAALSPQREPVGFAIARCGAMKARRTLNPTYKQK